MISDSIPIELILEILLRLPAKSIVRFHCLSKLWASMLRGPYFTEMFRTRSSAQPRILLAIEEHGLWSFFSSPQNLSPYEKSLSSSLVVAAEFHMKFPPDNMPMCLWPRSSHYRRVSCGYASGLIYFDGIRIKEKYYYGVRVICNPITGRYTALPCLKRYRKAYSFFGFDPIDKQFKVLLMASSYAHDRHKILTLGSGEMRWRSIKCSLTHGIVSEGICFNGILYYLGDTSEGISYVVIVCFDVRSEKFKFIYRESYCELINYMGKLGVVYNYDYVDGTIDLRVWILEDEEKQEWSKYAYTLKNKKLACSMSVVGVTVMGEIVLSISDFAYKELFYLLYFNLKKNTLHRVDIQGIGEYHERRYSCNRLHVVADHIEDLNVNDPKLLKSSIYAPYVKTEEEESESESSSSSSSSEEEED